MVELRPVIDQYNGRVILFDIYRDGQWLGSRRTVEQCEFLFDGFTAPPILTMEECP